MSQIKYYHLLGSKGSGQLPGCEEAKKFMGGMTKQTKSDLAKFQDFLIL